jgi:hypothetical protein
VAAAASLLVTLAVASGSMDPQYQVIGGPFDFRGLGGGLLVANQLAVIYTGLVVVVAAGSLVVRFRRARGVERQQLRWVAWAAALVVWATVVALGGLAVGLPAVVTWALATLAVVPVAIGAAILRYRLYDLDRIISRTLAYGLLTLLLGGGYAALVLGLGQLVGSDSSLIVAGATLAVAAVFGPVRRRIQAVVDRRFNRGRHDAAHTIAVFSDRLHQQIDLDALAAELLAVADQTMQPTQVSLWLRPSGSAPQDQSTTDASQAARQPAASRTARPPPDPRLLAQPDRALLLDRPAQGAQPQQLRLA